MGKLNLELSDDHLKAIGRVAAYCSYLESNVSWITGRLIGDDITIQQIVTTKLKFPELCDLLKSIGKYRLQEDQANKLCALLGKATTVYEKRHPYIHSIWGAGKSTSEITRLKFTTKGKGRPILEVEEEVTADKISQVADEIGAVVCDLVEFQFEIFAASQESTM